MIYSDVNEMGISHFALSSVYNAPDVIEELSNIVDVIRMVGLVVKLVLKLAVHD